MYMYSCTHMSTRIYIIEYFYVCIYTYDVVKIINGNSALFKYIYIIPSAAIPCALYPLQKKKKLLYLYPNQVKYRDCIPILGG